MVVDSGETAVKNNTSILFFSSFFFSFFFFNFKLWVRFVTSTGSIIMMKSISSMLTTIFAALTEYLTVHVVM